MKHPDARTAVAICQKLVKREGIGSDGFYSPVKCDTIVDLAHLRATNWKCPMCGQEGDREVWKPTAVGTIFRRVA